MNSTTLSANVCRSAWYYAARRREDRPENTKTRRQAVPPIPLAYLRKGCWQTYCVWQESYWAPFGPVLSETPQRGKVAKRKMLMPNGFWLWYSSTADTKLILTAVSSRNPRLRNVFKKKFRSKDNCMMEMYEFGARLFSKAVSPGY